MDGENTVGILVGDFEGFCKLGNLEILLGAMGTSVDSTVRDDDGRFDGIVDVVLEGDIKVATEGSKDDGFEVGIRDGFVGARLGNEIT
jgi:hypothetical protein